MKLLEPSVRWLTSELCQYLAIQMQNNGKHSAVGHSITLKLNDNLSFPFVSYSLLTLLFDIEPAKYCIFVGHTGIGCSNGQSLVQSVKQLVNVRNRVQKSPLFHVFPCLLAVTKLQNHFFNQINSRCIRTILEDALQYRYDNGLIGLQQAHCLPKKLSRKSVKFRDEVYKNHTLSDEQVIHARANEFENRNVPPVYPDGISRQKAKLKELTLLDIILDYQGMNSRNEGLLFYFI